MVCRGLLKAASLATGVFVAGTTARKGHPDTSHSPQLKRSVFLRRSVSSANPPDEVLM